MSFQSAYSAYVRTESSQRLFGFHWRVSREMCAEVRELAVAMESKLETLRRGVAAVSVLAREPAIKEDFLTPA